MSDWNELYNRALDEIYALRAMLACEARILEAHGEYKTFPKSRRGELDDSVAAMRLAASGAGFTTLHANRRYRWHRQELETVAGTATLTRQQWEGERSVDTGTAQATTPCYCPVGELGHAWNPTPGWCPNPQQPA